jgi:DNA-directed RNA polymerase specialized sigma24 family protein
VADPKTTHSRKRWELDREGLDALLAALETDRERAGRKYEDLRRRLINLFAWEQCEAPEDLADEVLNRVSRKVIEGVPIPHFDRFAFGIARLVIQEEIRKQRTRQNAVREFPPPSVAPDRTLLDSMRDCLAHLPPDRRELIEHYYAGDRPALARRLGLSINALRNRALRIRDELAKCMASRRDES